MIAVMTMTSPAVLGLDLSLTRTGWATADGYGVLVPPKGKDRGLPRLQWIRDAVLELAAGVDLVAVEGYSFGSRNSHAHALGELGGVVRLALYEAGAVIAAVPPAVLKKYATGRGNAPKGEVLAAAIRRLGYAGHDDNEADALWLLAAAWSAYEHADAVQVPQVQRSALGAILWPAVAATGGRTP